MFLIALRENNGAKDERVVVRQVVRIGQVTDLTERCHAHQRGSTWPGIIRTKLCNQLNYWLEDAQTAGRLINRNVPSHPWSCGPTVPAIHLTRTWGSRSYRWCKAVCLPRLAPISESSRPSIWVRFTNVSVRGKVLDKNLIDGGL